MAFDEDFSEFFDLDGFGIQAIIGGTSVVGIFEETFIIVLGVEGLHPTFTCAQADIPNASHGDLVDIETVAYKIHGMQKDGTGMIVLILEDQA